MAKTAAERAKAYRQRKRDAQRNETVTRVTQSSQRNVTTYSLPALPDDDVISCNHGIGWPDILAMSKSDIDYVYRAWLAIGDSLLLRLRRAAGYHERVGAA